MSASFYDYPVIIGLLGGGWCPEKTPIDTPVTYCVASHPSLPQIARSEQPDWSPIDKYSEAVVTDVLSLVNAEAQEILFSYNSELLES